MMRNRKITVFLVLLMVIVWMIPSCHVSAEEQGFDIENEWYVGTIYIGQHRRLTRKDETTLVSKNDSISYSINESDNSIQITIEDDDYLESADAYFVKLHSSTFLVYNWLDDMPAGYLVQKASNATDSEEYNCWDFSCDTTFLFWNGNTIMENSKGTQRVEYLFTGDSLFLCHEDEYVGGEMRQLGDSAFIFNTGETIEWDESLKIAPTEIWLILIDTNALE